MGVEAGFGVWVGVGFRFGVKGKLGSPGAARWKGSCESSRPTKYAHAPRRDCTSRWKTWWGVGEYEGCMGGCEGK